MRVWKVSVDGVVYVARGMEDSWVVDSAWRRSRRERM
jgi:hypothetical protein